MRTKRKRRLIAVCLIIAGVAVAVGLTLMALKENINVFYSPSQIFAGEAPANSSIRVGGMVVDGSVQRNQSNLDVTFALTDTAETVTVFYKGILPDLFREGQGIVALGKMQDGKFIASQVLAKHDETYMPPEVDHALKAANKDPYNAATQQ
jgi:cytochrome c-type biogenesis protein CcmE